MISDDSSANILENIKEKVFDKSMLLCEQNIHKHNHHHRHHPDQHHITISSSSSNTIIIITLLGAYFTIIL